MLLSRLRPKKSKEPEQRQKKKVPELEEFLGKRDYSGAISFLQFKLKNETLSDADIIMTELWLSHCYFRAGEYQKALEVYEAMYTKPENPGHPALDLYMGCCYFYLGMYPEARKHCDKAEKCPLRTRLSFHIAHKMEDEKLLLQNHSQLTESIEDQMSLACIHYLRQHYQPAADIYKKIIVGNKNFIGCNVYLAMCYNKLDYHEVSNEVLEVFLRQYPDSPAAVNLKACNIYKQYQFQGVAVPEIQHELDRLSKMQLYPSVKALVNHNYVVFRNGDGALQILPALLDIVPEARLNLIIYYLKRDEVDNANALASQLEPSSPGEFLVKAILFTKIAQQRGSKDHRKTAEQFFKMVGESTAECDTISGRQAMASSYFLAKKWDDVILYMNSIKTYFPTDDTFNFNLGQALVMSGQYGEGEATLLQVQAEEKKTIVYQQLLCRAYVHNNKPQMAWDIYKRTLDTKESYMLLRQIAHDAYLTGEFFYAFLSFDSLEKIDPSPDNWNGKKGSTAGVFRQLVNGEATREQMTEVLQLLETGNHPQVDFISETIRKWARENGVHL